LNRVFETYAIQAVYHFAASSLVGESVSHPLKYYDNNVVGTLRLLECMHHHQVKHIVFSSTAAVYGEPETVPITESQRKAPTNTYGQTKLAVEDMLKWAGLAHGIKSVCLRYFNVAGAAILGQIGEAHNPETHLIPNVIKAAQGLKALTVFGNDYPTPDGTCIRDYIHVVDLVAAHEKAMQYLEKGGKSTVFNLGNGGGFSVKQIIDATEAVVGQTIPYEIKARRAGDPAVLVADATKAREVLGWVPQYTDVKAIIETAWRWHQSHPHGYEV
jgi:UDP-glucose 4-epimerase